MILKKWGKDCGMSVWSEVGAQKQGDGVGWREWN